MRRIAQYVVLRHIANKSKELEQQLRSASGPRSGPGSLRKGESSIRRELQRAMSGMTHQAKELNWIVVFQSSFIILFVAYPGQ